MSTAVTRTAPIPATRTRTSRARPAANAYDDLEPLFVRLAELGAADPRRKSLREGVIRQCLPLAENIARKYAGRGENFEDLLQTARVGLMVAIDRFDPAHGAPFLSFAIPTIMGEVRRHFRDYTWAVRVPRRLKELQLVIGPAIDTLFQRLGRTPTAAEIAAELDTDPVEITRALLARNAYRSSSLDARIGSEDAAPSPLDDLGIEQPEFSLVEDRMAVKPLIEALSERDRRALILRYFESQSQSRIAESFGVSQMQVSRILSRTLNSLHEQLFRD